MTAFTPPVMFHHFTNEDYPAGQGALSANDFERMLHFIGLDNLLPAEEWLAAYLSGKLKPHQRCLTFDDALKCQYLIARPVMEAHGLTGFFFVYSSVFEGNLERLEVYRYFRDAYFDSIEDFYTAFDQALSTSHYASEAEEALKGFDPASYLADFSFYTQGDRHFRYLRDKVLGPVAYNALMDQLLDAYGLKPEALHHKLWMTDADLKQLRQNGHVVGLHSHSHPTCLEQLPVEQQEWEYRENIAHLTQVLGQPPTTVAHPCNSYNAATLTLLKTLGIRVGFRSNTKPGFTSPLELPREDHALVWKAMQATATAI